MIIEPQETRDIRNEVQMTKNCIRWMIKKISSCAESAISTDYVVYLQDNSFDIATRKILKLFMKQLVVHNLINV